MSCTISQEQLFSWVDRRAPELDDHLAQCESCRLRARELQESIGEVASAIGQTAPKFPERIGEYEVQALLGSGGQGWVFEALQPAPRRRVAVKVVKGGCVIDDRDVRRLQREAAALGLLSHPGIASIFEAGCTIDGQQYFAMELVKGRPLLEFANEKQLTHPQRLDLFLQVCSAMEYAHRQGVIHRDLKPSNILVAPDGHPKILDFGLAHLSHPEDPATMTLIEPGRIIGTLPYMSPEHAKGSEITFASDVYCLCVILYELLTGHAPYEIRAQAPHQGLRVICEQAPDAPRKHDARVRGDIETILLKGLEKDPARRYQSVAALADDIRRCLARQPISARRPGTFYRMRKLISRNRATAAMMALVVSVAASMGAWITLMYAEARTTQRSFQEPTSPFENGLIRAQAAEINWAQGNYAKAETLSRQALANLRGQVDDNNKIVLNTRVILGRALVKQGNTKEAEPLLRKTMQGLAQFYPTQEGPIAEAKSALGECLVKTGMFRQAELLMRDTYPDIIAYRGPGHRRTVEAKQALFDLYTRWGKPDLASLYGTPRPAPSRGPVTNLAPGG